MKLLLAADGSKYTKKALAWLLANQAFEGADDELVVLHVQPPLPPRVRTAVGAQVVKDYYGDECAKVLSPIERLLRLQSVPFRSVTVVGDPHAEILRVAAAEKSNLIVMGTHGRGLLGRAVMGSVAQRVLADATVPVLMIK
jgi:nucleotide-binding universal stress UspA family protein